MKKKYIIALGVILLCFAIFYIYSSNKKENSLTEKINNSYRMYNYNVYVDDTSLLFISDSPLDSNLNTNFYFHVVPENKSDLDSKDPNMLDRNNLDFVPEKKSFGLPFWSKYSEYIYTKKELPKYPVKYMYLGQFKPGVNTIWQQEFSLNDLKDISKLTLDTTKISKYGFDAYLNDKNNRIIYVCKNNLNSVKDFFFLHLFPNNSNGSDFINLDFVVDTNKLIKKGDYMYYVRELPDSNVRYLNTGQYKPETGRIWQKDILLAQNKVISNITVNKNSIENKGYDIYYNKENSCIVYFLNEKKLNFNNVFFLHVYEKNSKSDKFTILDFPINPMNLIKKDNYYYYILILPNLNINYINTGQYNDKGRIWEQKIENK